LKNAYRERLSVNRDVCFVYLKADFEMTAERLGRRRGHFMREGLLRSQFETLEEPGPEVVAVETGRPPALIVTEIRERLFPPGK
jgi:gluconokinase